LAQFRFRGFQQWRATAGRELDTTIAADRALMDRIRKMLSP
jgi:hypothetical protein